MILPERLRALIVDDNAYARSATAASLRKLGLVEIVEAETGVDAIGLLAERTFDVLFLDWYMPEINGAGLLQVVREGRVARTTALPVVMITAYATRENIERAKKLGVNEVLTKPFTSDHVALALARVLPRGWDLPPDEEKSAEDAFLV